MTTTTPEGAGEFPPLPKPIAQIGKFLDDSTDVFDGSQVHAFAEATVVLRAQAAEGEPSAPEAAVPRSEVHRAWALMKDERNSEAYEVLSTLVGWDAKNAVPLAHAAPAPASEAVAKTCPGCDMPDGCLPCCEDCPQHERKTAEKSVPPLPKVRLHLPDGDAREALASFVYWEGGELHVCLNVRETDSETLAERTTLKAHARNLRTESAKLKSLYDYFQAAAEEIEVIAYREAAPTGSESGDAVKLDLPEELSKRVLHEIGHAINMAGPDHPERWAHAAWRVIRRHLIDRAALQSVKPQEGASHG